MPDHPELSERCHNCSRRASHRFSEDLRTGFGDLVLCCECFTLMRYGSYKHGFCSRGLTLEEMGLKEGADGVWRNF